ncbi:hypothetical protein [Citrobacter freundii]|uniref:Uncharacterized protein n=1 Tax=Citrobacter freundii TaxID=546 RepID=A0A7G2IYD0_CITFR|nr:hypothetical protein [Citrobacter freundii]
MHDVALPVAANFLGERILRAGLRPPLLEWIKLRGDPRVVL